ncbi:uncharacterized protein LOC126838595 [Adelges cooleyi]|uniref:uncharacterized protein LOC126838595 n=1 Tax=Adelges cooleyi TaxID=133065 RepID=UPI002180943B|nr:uncharacterized protein LOC126838595 [Adelges cooleyi]
MFSKNIIVLLCVVCFIEKSSTKGSKEITEETKNKIKYRPTAVVEEKLDDDSAEISEETSDELVQPAVKSSKNGLAEDEASSGTAFSNPKLDNMQTVQWEEMFKKYDTKGKGSISPEELQKLIYDEFKGFITIRHLETYIKILDLKKQFKINAERLEKMKQIIAVVSKKENRSEKDKNTNTNATITEAKFTQEINESAKLEHLFETPLERLEIFNLISPKVNFPIEASMFEEIMEMFEASAVAEEMLQSFLDMDKDKNFFLNRDELFDIFKAIEPYTTTKQSVERMFKHRDLNGDNRIDFGEYMIMMVEPDTTIRITPKRFARLMTAMQGLKFKKKDMLAINPTGKDILTLKDIAQRRKI